MFVKGHELAEGFRGEPPGEDRVGRAVALEDAVGHEPIGRSFRLDLLGRLAESQRLGLGEDVRQKHIVVTAQGIEAFAEGDEVTWDEPGALMNQRLEGFLAVVPRFPPVDGARIALYLR